ncbi:OLC1v1015131C2 [Oldenlandia corymbosa var. corymbosa]|uniref:OLC1v1015131C2 n=1 Tax=Oldenlandia corymbosa var. corymbosa TaxID=529605 RepID=A0AAV1E2E3_OLDCO|nr:OLC1v1015131C2 [Oldenlandia corymbosa var. corymbosa]
MAVPTMDTLSLGKSAPRCVSITTKIILHSILNPLLKIQWFAFLFSFIDAILAVYFRTICKLSSCTVVMDDEQTSMHFWAPKRRDPRKPNLLMIHGYGGDSKWQFMYQAGPLSQSFNLYAPDLVFFGKSYSTRPDRTTAFQAKCVAQGMEQLGVGRYSVYSISYGGYVAYSMAEMNPESVEKMVIVSSGIALTEEQKAEHLGKLEKDVVDLLVPQKAEDLRLLLNLSIHKYDRFKGYPDIFLQGFIDALGQRNRKEKKELIEHLMAKKPDDNLSIIPQETLLVWGDSDKVFPLVFGQQLQRHLGSKAKLKILKDTGHASNMESAHLLNDCMKEFLLSKSYFSKEN